MQKAGTPKANCEAVQQTASPRHSRKVLQIVKVISIGEIFDQIASHFLAKVMKASSSQMSSTDSVLFLKMLGLASHTHSC
jgi:hypothetical protein